MRKNKSGFRYGGHALRVSANTGNSPNLQPIRECDAMPDDPEALIAWGLRNIQGEPADEFERRRHPRPRQNRG
jgi:hypothetical protein